MAPAETSAVEDAPFDFPPLRSRIVEVVSALNRLGVLTEPGLKATRAAWDGVTVQDSMRWEEVVRLNASAFARLAEATGREYEYDDAQDRRFLCEHRTFPLYTLDLSQAKVDLEDLRQERDHRLAHEFGIADEFGYPD